MSEENFLFKELSFGIIGICIEIQKEYGNFHNERVYQKVLEEKLTKEEIKFLAKPRIKVYSKDSGNIVGYYEPDVIVEEKIILELKAKPIILKNHEVQLSEYIKTTEYEIGYVVNFGIKPLYFKRIIYTNDKKNLKTNKH
ncbi:MAG: GxxExxY protein [Parcubacteria group bacterium]|jgi:GxxExxY protein